MISPHPPVRGAVPALRGGMLAVTSTALAVTAHGMAGGGWPDALPVLPLTALIAVAGTALADRRRSGWAMLGALGVAELSQHVLLSVLCSPRSGGPFAPAVMTTAHAVATLLTALVLAKADSAVVTAASTLVTLLPQIRTNVPPVMATTVPLISASPSDRVLDVLFRRVCGRRGPPIAS